MAYTPQAWLDFPSTSTPTSAARFAYMEAGIQAAASPTIDDVTDATATGKAVVRAVSQSAARSAIGAAAVGGANTGVVATSVKTGSYTAAVDEMVQLNPAANCTITMPATPVDASMVGVQIIGNLGVYTVTLAGGGGEFRFDGSAVTSVALTTVPVSTWKYQAAGNFWFPISFQAATTAVDILDSGTVGRDILQAETESDALLALGWPRASQVTNVTSWTINTDAVDYAENVGLTGAVTINMSGTPRPGQRLHVAVTGTASRAITHGSGFEASGGQALPTTTSGTARLDIDYIWNPATSKMRCLRAV